MYKKFNVNAAQLSIHLNSIFSNIFQHISVTLMGIDYIRFIFKQCTLVEDMVSGGT